LEDLSCRFERRRPVPLMPGENEQSVPTWSADGTRICFGDVPSSYGHLAGARNGSTSLICGLTNFLSYPDLRVSGLRVGPPMVAISRLSLLEKEDW